MTELTQSLPGLKFELQIIDLRRGIAITPPELNLLISVIHEGIIFSSLSIPADIMQSGIDSIYTRLVKNYKGKK